MGAMLSGRGELNRMQKVTKEILSDNEEISTEAETVRIRIVALQNCRTEKDVGHYPHGGIQVTSGNAAHIFPIWNEDEKRVILVYQPYNDESSDSLRFKEIFRNAEDIQIGSR